ncbi:MAG: aminoglycoside phosphotransferase family protein [Polyangiaceae bacterium]|nr:aminoglycoside phosphotransferase family protein [Polyangiaceae bacterium]
MEEGWERPPRLDLSIDELQHLVEPAFRGASVVEHEVIGTGLANTNIRFRLRGEGRSYVLRIHTRDPNAAVRERDLMSYLAKNRNPPIPVPPLIYSDVVPSRGANPYSIWGFVEGMLLQDLFGTLPDSELIDVARSCGQVAAALSTHRFSRCGEFGTGLEIVEEYGTPSRFVPAAVHDALFGGLSGERLGAQLRDSLWKAVERTSALLTMLDDRYSLVHSDYKRSNIVVARSGATWSVAAVLDWEFAFAGPPLVDVGLFLRAGDALPVGFRDAFVGGYREAGGELPEEWLRLSRLVDLLSQMTFLNDPRDRPRVVAETIKVVEETVRVLA